MEIERPAMTDYQRVEIATEYAFNELYATAVKVGLHLDPVMGLMYLPTQAVTEQFKQACRAALADLGARAPAAEKESDENAM